MGSCGLHYQCFGTWMLGQRRSSPHKRPGQYRAAVARFGSIETVVPSLPDTALAAGTGALSDAVVDEISSKASTNAAALTKSATFRASLPCQLESGTCKEQVIQHLAQLAFRRPLLAEESNSLARFWGDENTRFNDQWRATELLLTVLLQSPSFIYREESSDGKGRLTNYGIASRMSFALTQRTSRRRIA